MKTYSEKLQSKEWAKKRKEIIDRDCECTSCNSDKNLQVHHTYYYNVRTNPWEYPNDSLITLCKSCHQEIHGITVTNIKPLPHNIVAKPGQEPYIPNQEDWTGYKLESPNSYLSKYGEIIIGGYRFANWANVKKFNRAILSSYPKGIVTDDKLIEFASQLYKAHPKYGHRFVELTGTVKIDINTEVSSWNKYSNFFMEFENGDMHNFSSNKCIDNLRKQQNL